MSRLEGLDSVVPYHQRLFAAVVDAEKPKPEPALKLLDLIAPQHRIGSISKGCASARDPLTKTLGSLLHHLSSDPQNFSLHDAKNKLISTNAPAYLVDYISELETGGYDAAAVKEYLGWYLRLTLTSHGGEGYLTQERIQALSDRILKGNCKITTDGDSDPAYLFLDSQTDKPFARLKVNRNQFFSSYKDTRPGQSPILPNMPLTASTIEHELIGYEQNQLFGFVDHTPTTLGAHFVNEKGELESGVIQEFVHGLQGMGFYNPVGANLLLNIPNHHVHMLVFSGLFKGLSAHHLNNYLFQLENNAGRIGVKQILEIDLEELLLPYNRLDQVKDLALDPSLMAHKQEAINMIILCRMWLLGLPQNDKPFDRALLMAMSHPKLGELLEDYHRFASTYSQMDAESWTMQKERVAQMQSICHRELVKGTITLTPRDLYFEIFGGRHIYDVAKAHGFPDLVAFNNFVADPYRYFLKTFSQADLNHVQDYQVAQREGESSQSFHNRATFYQKMAEFNVEQEP